MACDPDGPTTVEALRALDRLGADVIELGVPYSDPLADGPVIQAAATRALEGGCSLDKVRGAAAGGARPLLGDCLPGGGVEQRRAPVGGRTARGFE